MENKEEPIRHDNTKNIRVLCVDDNVDLAAMFSVMLNAEDGFESAGILTSADELVAEIEAKHPDVVLMDLAMPGRDPFEAMQEAARRYPATRAIVVSGYDDPERMERAIDHGAWGFVSKSGDFEQILVAIRSVAKGETWMNRDFIK